MKYLLPALFLLTACSTNHVVERVPFECSIYNLGGTYIRFTGNFEDEKDALKTSEVVRLRLVKTKTVPEDTHSACQKVEPKQEN